MKSSFDSIYNKLFELIKSKSVEIIRNRNGEIYVDIDDTFFTCIHKTNSGELLKKFKIDKNSLFLTVRNGFDYTEPDLSDIKSITLTAILPEFIEPVFLADISLAELKKNFNNWTIKQISRVHNYKMRNHHNIRIRHISIGKSDFHEYGRFIPFTLSVGIRNSLLNRHIRPIGYSDSVCSVFEERWYFQRKQINCSIPDVQNGVIKLIIINKRKYPAFILPVIFTYYCDDIEKYYYEGAIEFSIIIRQTKNTTFFNPKAQLLQN